ncbi:MAG: dihydrolipoamide acetyltransferase family protein [Deinococcota bacterium]
MASVDTTDITLPQLGETADEAEVLVWLKQVGDTVTRGEALFEVQTDKITVEVPALESGVLLEHLVRPGDVVMVGDVVARLEPVSQAMSESSQKSQPSAAIEDASKRSLSASPDMSSGISAEPFRDNNKYRASPSARRLARELNISLVDVDGSGPRGRITSDDVRAAYQPKSAETLTSAVTHIAPMTSVTSANTTPANATSANATFASSLPDANDVTLAQDDVDASSYKLTKVEQISAQVTTQSFAQIPHFYVTVRADASALQTLVGSLQGVSINDLIVMAVARALKDHPRLNASVTSGDTLTLHDHVHIGVITAAPQGVMTSVVRDVDTLTAHEVHARVREVRARLASGRATSADISGATFAISNLGMYNVEAFSAIILPPNVAMLAVGTLKEDVFVNAGALRPGYSINLTLSADHRALDGVAVALFLNSLRDIIQEPHSLSHTAEPTSRRSMVLS